MYSLLSLNILVTIWAGMNFGCKKYHAQDVHPECRSLDRGPSLTLTLMAKNHYYNNTTNNNHNNDRG